MTKHFLSVNLELPEHIDEWIRHQPDYTKTIENLVYGHFKKFGEKKND